MLSDTGLQLEPYQIVYRPLVTEKGTYLSESFNAYTFAVNPLASKIDIRAAVEKLWNVKVVNVRTQNRHGKTRRHKMRTGTTKAWKKAIIQLDPESKISFF